MVRDYGLLESAALAPQEMRFGEYINRTLRSQAATYWFSLGVNRPFVDGNARTGLVVCEVFLQVNGFQLDTDEALLVDLVKRMASRQITAKERLVQALRVRAL
jgi:death-on-curing protein